MKLRNKKTGEIVTFVTLEEIYDDELDFTYIKNSGNENELSYSSLKKFNDEWEDYKPPEPLIEKRSHRGVLRAAAQMSGTSKAHVCKSDRAGVVLFEFNGKEICSVELKDKGIHTDHDGWYTIAELCGEEEE